jgi:glycosyltransferase involved in cell wall biosynthesis
MKLLLSTYSCFPCSTSEPGNAWRLIHELLPDNQIWAVVEQGHYAEGMKRHLAAHPLPGFHPIYFRLVPALEKLLRGRGVLEGVYYHLWQRKLEGVVRELQRQHEFDLCHHVTFGRYWSPSGLRRLELPFIWGPVGAAETPPKAFVSELPLRARIFEAARNSARGLARHSRALRQTAAAATVGIGVTRESCQALRNLGVGRVEQLPQTALTPAELAVFEGFPAPPAGPLRALCMGRLLHWKGFHLAIRAFSAFARGNPEAELWLINDGPYRGYFERTAAECGARNQVRFLGHLPNYAAVLEKLAQSHVLLHPALHEGFGNVCLEALAAGRPVACLDIGGPASQISPETGFAAPATTPEEAVVALAGFLERIDKDRLLLGRMSAAARARVRTHFTMERFGKAIRTMYAEACSGRGKSSNRPLVDARSF